MEDNRVKKSRPFLLGGTGWMRRITALEEGRRYVPKGGNVVDFSIRTPLITRGAYKNASKEVYEMNEISECEEFSETRSNGVASTFNQGARPLFEAQQGPTFQPKEDAVAALEKQDASASKPISNSQRIMGSLSNNRLPHSPARTSWRPPGGVHQGAPNSAVPRRLGTRVAGAARSSQQPRNSKMAGRTSSLHICDDCARCKEFMKRMEEEKEAARHERAAAVRMRRRLEASLDRAAKEEADFQNFKEEETTRLQAAVAEASRKLQRDRLAEDARVRAGTKESSQCIKENLRNLTSQLDAERRETHRLEKRFQQETDRLRWHNNRLEVENADLRKGIETLEAERIQSWPSIPSASQRQEKRGGDEPGTLAAPAVDRAVADSCNTSLDWSSKTQSQQLHHRFSTSSATTTPNCDSLRLHNSPAVPPRQGTHTAGGGCGQVTPTSPLPQMMGALPEDAHSVEWAQDWSKRNTSPSRTNNDAGDTSYVSDDCIQSSDGSGGDGSTGSSHREEEEDKEDDDDVAPGNDQDSCPNGMPLVSTAKEMEPPAPPFNMKAPEIKQFPNGSVRRRWADGHAVTSYSNGDYKQEYPSGIVEYFYRQVNCWQVTHPSSGVEVFYFPAGKVEAHLPNGAKETLHPDSGGAFRTLPGGKKTVTVPHTLLCREIVNPRPMRLDR